MTKEEIYRRQAKILLKKRNKAKALFVKHKPSIGYVGEHLLRQSLKIIIPKEYGVCQGFVCGNEFNNEEQLSSQCDIIIYRKEKKAVEYSVGDLKVIHSHYVVAVIEEKSSIKQESFFTTLEAFEKLERIGVKNNCIFVFGPLSAKTLSKWLFKYKTQTSNEVIKIDSELYDWPDKDWLPKSILSLESCKYYVLGHIQDENDDLIGYASYRITDKTDKEISCIQEFFSKIMELTESPFVIDLNDYSIKDGFPLWYM